ncbi:MAG TPA: hypothetical protein VGQ47_02205, partial [Candidatus Limnocylindrales bacterium]|nr:hypothetical protein [Candidatus Limnocylindrales bacterium]
VLAALPGRRVAVLGEMLELGDASAEAHRQVGGLAAVVVELLVVVGPGAIGIVEGARAGGLADERILHVADAGAAFETLRPRLRPTDVVLVKASRGLELDRLVERLQVAGDPSLGPLGSAEGRA